MTIKTYIRSLLLGALITLSLAGFMIHARVHLITENSSFIIPFLAGILSVAVVPTLFWFKKTLAYGYPNMGWWLLHLVAISLVYYLGNLLWS